MKIKVDMNGKQFHYKMLIALLIQKAMTKEITNNKRLPSTNKTIY